MRSRPRFFIAATLSLVLFLPSTSPQAGTITQQGAVTALSDVSQMGPVLEGRFDEPNAADSDSIP